MRDDPNEGSVPEELAETTDEVEAHLLLDEGLLLDQERLSLD